MEPRWKTVPMVHGAENVTLTECKDFRLRSMDLIRFYKEVDIYEKKIHISYKGTV